MDTLVDDNIITDIIPFETEHISLTPRQLAHILKRTAEVAYEAAEAKRQAFLTTPDGLRDKTIHGYKPLPYHLALAQSSLLKPVPLTGTEKWNGDKPFELPPEVAQLHFAGVLISERTDNAETS